jgi:hypothetical protein
LHGCIRRVRGDGVRLTRRGNILVAMLLVAGFITVNYLESVGLKCDCHASWYPGA